MNVIDVAAALVFRDGKLLITQRYANSHLGGLWEFPGGKREHGESFEDCLARELREELGIDVEVGQLIESLNHDYPEKSVHLRFFKCRWLKHEPHPLGCPAFAWITPGDLGNYEFPAADARLLKMLSSNLSLWK
jgi:mutator protein MutT